MTRTLQVDRSLAAPPPAGMREEVVRLGRRRRRLAMAGLSSAAAGVVVVVMLVAAAAGGGSDRLRIQEPVAPQPIAADPLSLVGAWHVVAPGVPEDTALLLGEELWLFRTCGLLSGAWRAGHGGSFIGMTDGGSSRCFEPGLAQRSSDLAWLNEASAFRSDGERRLLVDSAGRVLATLTPGARPSPRPDHAAQFAEPPVVTDELRARFREPAPLPERLEPATVATLRGGWVTAAAADRGNGRGFVEFKDGMTWAGSDGCNGLSGRFAVDARGELLTTHGFSTLIGCDMSPATQWVGQTRRAAFDGETLVLLDVDAHELGRLVRKAS